MEYPFDITVNTFKFSPIEIVEKKGIGHPDSLADQIAECSCRAICNYYNNKYKAIYRFNIDQVEIGGGQIEINFGHGQILKPANIRISGIAFCVSQQEHKKLSEIVVNSTKKLLTTIFDKDILKVFKIKSDIGIYSAKNKKFFEDEKLPLSEDTAIGIGFYPYTLTERLVLDIEKELSEKLIKKFPIGKDTKIMIIRKGNKEKTQIIISIAFLGEKIRNINEYFLVKNKIKKELLNLVQKKVKQKVELFINAADNKKNERAYLTLTGTAAEHDKGTVGRGNRVSGLISFYRPVSFEAIYGKNPVFHTGKLYNFLAFYLAKKIAKKFNNKLFVEVSILSKLGNPINLPEIVSVNTSKKINRENVRLIILGEFKNLFQMVPNSNYTKLTDIILNNTI